MKTAILLKFFCALLLMATAGCGSDKGATYVKRKQFTFEVARVIWPYPVLQDVAMHPGENFSEKRLGAVTLIILGNLKAEGIAPPSAGYCIALASSLPKEKLSVVVGGQYEAEIYEHFIPAMYVPESPEEPWPQRITTIEELISLKRK